MEVAPAGRELGLFPLGVVGGETGAVGPADGTVRRAGIVAVAVDPLLLVGGGELLDVTGGADLDGGDGAVDAGIGCGEIVGRPRSATWAYVVASGFYRVQAVFFRRFSRACTGGWVAGRAPGTMRRSKTRAASACMPGYTCW